MPTEESEVRSVSITGQAVQDLQGGEGKKKRATRKKQEGGSITASAAESAGSPNPATWLKAPVDYVQPVVRPVIHVSTHGSMPLQQPQSLQQPQPLQQSQPPQQHQSTVQEGGVKHIKVELKKKVATHKVKLNPKKADKPKKKHQTKKVRKITVGIHSLHKRMTRAKKVQKKITDMPIDKLKELLVSKKLIKSNSKAPESILRQIAADSQLVAKKVL